MAAMLQAQSRRDSRQGPSPCLALDSNKAKGEPKTVATNSAAAARKA